MADEKRMHKSFIERPRHASIRKEMSFFGTMSLDDEISTGNINRQSACQSPTFLRTHSSNGIFSSPRKSRSVSRFLGGLISTSPMNSNTNISDTSDSSVSIRFKIGNCASLNNLSRLSRCQTIPIKQSESLILCNVDHIIDENSEITHSLSEIDERYRCRKSASVKLLDQSVNNNNQRSLSRIARLRPPHLRRRSISCDSWDTDQQNMR